ncbi:hypothetical protein [Vallitalea maricola]|uniref:Uncharacterized protein n=1 Tax=Vallitalea maricola TaxID=3074433 RepID=A0ACB5UFE7_9FIRM|nr:hypothetical protein AN2V17_04820 [Vallitalea sp. AN17-2]
MKKLLKVKKLLLIGVLIIISISTLPVNAKCSIDNKEVVFNQEKLEKYSSVFEEMEKSLTIDKKNLENFNVLVLNNGESTKIVTSTIRNDDSAIETVGIIYSEKSSTSIIGVEETKIVTHAKLFIRTEISKDTNFRGDIIIKLSKIEGEVLALYDGATVKEIQITAGQGSVFDSNNNRTESFETTGTSYSKSYDWPYMIIDETQYSYAGHNAVWIIQRGSSTYNERISADY